MAEFPKVNDVYATFFEEPFPVRTTVGVAALPKGALVEMDATVPLPAPLSEGVSLEDVERAREVVADVVRRTLRVRVALPLAHDRRHDRAEGREPAAHRLLQAARRTQQDRRPRRETKGVVAGERRQPRPVGGLRRRARGLAATIFMPERAPLAKIAAARESGAEIVLRGESIDDVRRRRPSATRESEGLAFIHPFDDPAVIAGQGTIGLELLEDVPDLSKVLIPVGGGGLASGIAIAVKARRRGVEVVGVRLALRASPTGSR